MRPVDGTAMIGALPGDEMARPPLTPSDCTPKITGYRTLTDTEIAIINRIKAKAEEVRQLLVEVQAINGPHEFGDLVTPFIDRRWLAIGQNDLQKGFMAVIRAVARPETF